MTSHWVKADLLRVSAVYEGFPSRSPPIHIPIVVVLDVGAQYLVLWLIFLHSAVKRGTAFRKNFGNTPSLVFVDFQFLLTNHVRLHDNFNIATEIRVPFFLY